MHAGEMDACGRAGNLLMGSLHLYGQGVPKDNPAARAYFKKACDGGHKDACDHLGRMKP